MAIKAGRVGVAPDQVDEFGNINSEATSGYTKQEADAKFETQSHAASTYETKTDAAALQPKLLSVPIEMLSGSKLTVESTLQALNVEKFDRAEQRVLSAKNLLPNKASTQTVQGVTFTVNADGSVTANGTATADAVLWLTPSAIQDQLPKNEEIILSGCPQTGSPSTYYLSTRIGLLPGDSYVRNDIDSGAGAILKITEQNTLKCSLTVKNGQTVSDLTFKPMLRLAVDPDDTYAPYAMTNRESTEKIQGIINAATQAADFSAFKTAISSL